MSCNWKNFNWSAYWRISLSTQFNFHVKLKRIRPCFSRNSTSVESYFAEYRKFTKSGSVLSCFFFFCFVVLYKAIDESTNRKIWHKLEKNLKSQIAKYIQSYIWKEEIDKHVLHFITCILWLSVDNVII